MKSCLLEVPEDRSSP